MLDQTKRQQLATRYNLKIQTLSPLHIGSGADDLSIHSADIVKNSRGQLVVIDPQKLVPPYLTDAELDALVSGHRNLRDILRRMPDQRLHQLAAYRLRLPRPQGSVRSIRQQIKSHRHRPYIPGSTLKGAIRTVLACAIYGRKTIASEVNHVKNKGKFIDTVADDLIDQAIFRPMGDEAHYDLMRALQVSDTADIKSRSLGLGTIGVYSTRGNALEPKKFRIFAEVILPDSHLSATARLDRYLLDAPEAQARIQFGAHHTYLEDFIAQANLRAEAFIQHEMAFYRKYHCSDMVDFYNTLNKMLQAAKGSKNTCLLWLGWGPGWLAKTLGTTLDQKTISQVRQRFDRMGSRGVPLFPKSRRLFEIQDTLRPLGWVAVSFNKLQ